jgi:arylsulfatase A-like enzyme
MAGVQFFQWSVVAQAAAKPRERPNIVLILADDMGYGDASCYPQSWLNTPHLDHMADEGMRLTDFHSSCPVCSPTRAGLLTGRYQQRAGIPGVILADEKQNRHHGLFPHEVTFAELLQDAGYATAVFGKWHLGYQRKFNPIRHGFDHFRGYVSGNIDFISHVDRMGIADWWDGDKLTPAEGYVTHLITRHAVQFIEQHKNRPFCLYIAHEAVHSPYQGPFDKPVRAVGIGNIKGAGRKDIKQAYREMMTEMDRGVGAVLSTLKRLKIDSNTFVFFFSDNGATRNGSNGGLRGFKGSVWEGGHRVPAIARWPGRIPPGSVSDETLISIDILPTILDLTATKPPANRKLDGVSFAPVLIERKKLAERMLFWDYNGKQAVRQGRWKLVVGERGLRAKTGLYNLDDDPAEQRNLATSHPERVAKLRADLQRWQSDVANGATRQPKRAIVK